VGSRCSSRKNGAVFNHSSWSGLICYACTSHVARSDMEQARRALALDFQLTYCKRQRSTRAGEEGEGQGRGGRRDEGKGGICCNNALSKCTKSSFLAIYFQIGDSSYICGFDTTHQRCIGYGTRGRTCSSVVGGGTRGSGSKKCLPMERDGSTFGWLSKQGERQGLQSDKNFIGN